MAFESLQALVYGDGAGNKMSLAIKQATLNILMDEGFTYKTATPLSVNGNYGKAIYKVPEILGTQMYDAKDQWKWQVPQASDIEIPMDKRKIIRVKLEDFDDSRLGNWNYVISIIINSIGYAILNDLNAMFYVFLANAFDPANGPLTPAGGVGALVMPELVKDGVTEEEAKAMIYKLNREFQKINKTFNKNAMGVKKSDLLMLLDTMADPNIRQAFSNQPNTLSSRWVANNLEGYSLGGGVYYVLDKMIGTNITLNQSFNLDYTINTTAFAGFILHTQALAMPFNFQKAVTITDPEDGNPRLITKYQFGIGWLRPWLAKAIYIATPTKPAARNK